MTSPQESGPLAEAEVFKKYIAITEGRTVIMVTHRISVASLTDRIVVFRDGEIMEDGTHDDGWPPAVNMHDFIRSRRNGMTGRTGRDSALSSVKPFVSLSSSHGTILLVPVIFA